MSDAREALASRVVVDGAPFQPAFPLHATVSGVEAVVIPLAEYRRLLADRVEPSFEVPLKALRSVRPPRVAPLASTIERDPEVADFLRERFARADTLERAHQACRERFGADRTPSVSRIAKLRSKVQRGA